jgi:hypothetical protein
MNNVIGFHLRMTPKEREIVRCMARRERRSATAMIRQAIIEAAARRGLAAEDNVKQEAA